MANKDIRRIVDTTPNIRSNLTAGKSAIDSDIEAHVFRLGSEIYIPTMSRSQNVSTMAVTYKTASQAALHIYSAGVAKSRLDSTGAVIDVTAATITGKTGIGGAPSATYALKNHGTTELVQDVAIGDENVERSLSISTYQDLNHLCPIRFNRARGTKSSPADTSSGDVGMFLPSAFYNGGAFRQATDIRSVVDGTPGATYVPGKIVFRTATAAASLADRVIINSVGMGIASEPEAGFGLYVNGAAMSKRVVINPDTTAHTTDAYGGLYASSATGGSEPFDAVGNIVLHSRGDGNYRSIYMVTGNSVRFKIDPDGIGKFNSRLGIGGSADATAMLRVHGQVLAARYTVAQSGGGTLSDVDSTKVLLTTGSSYPTVADFGIGIYAAGHLDATGKDRVGISAQNTFDATSLGTMRWGSYGAAEGHYSAGLKQYVYGTSNELDLRSAGGVARLRGYSGVDILAQNGTISLAGLDATASMEGWQGFLERQNISCATSSLLVAPIMDTTATTRRRHVGGAVDTTCTTYDTSCSTRYRVLSPNLTVANDDIYSVAPQAFTTTAVGWSSLSSTNVYYRRVGKIVFVTFSLLGTSNSSTASFSIPHRVRSPGDPKIPCCCLNDGTAQTTPAVAVLAYNSTTVSVLRDFASTTYTASGAKGIYGQFFYETDAT